VAASAASIHQKTLSGSFHVKALLAQAPKKNNLRNAVESGALFLFLRCAITYPKAAKATNTATESSILKRSSEFVILLRLPYHRVHSNAAYTALPCKFLRTSQQRGGLAAPVAHP
jgi:hypothetical protein